MYVDINSVHYVQIFLLKIDARKWEKVKIPEYCKKIKIMMFGMVSWHFNYCRLFNSKSFLHINIKYDSEEHFKGNLFKRAIPHFFFFFAHS